MLNEEVSAFKCDRDRTVIAIGEDRQPNLGLLDAYTRVASYLCPIDILQPFDAIKISTPNRINSNCRKAFIVNANVPIRTESKIGRNDVCICGSGKKYKHCCLSNP